MNNKIYVNYDNMATIVCPDCKKIRMVDVSKIVTNKSSINIRCKCKCGNVFNTTIERRRFFRKNTKFHGRCYIRSEESDFPIVVTDISRSGLKFEQKSMKKLNVGDEMHIDFYLDDPEKSLINKIIIIKSISKNNTVIGAEFKSSEHYDKLGSYLLYKS